MQTARIIMHALAVVIIAMVAAPPLLPAQETGEQEVEEQAQSVRFSQEELTQMLAPIALYPDSLTAQILMASTYPLEIVEAERWLRQNSSLKGEDLDKALKDRPWDPSVKALCHFPDLLFSMSDKLDQTRKLGDAFLSQKDEVMTTIQELRRRAKEQGNLETTAEQKVLDDQGTITIEPAEPQVVYLPVYDPLYVYGPWGYPAYPPYYWYYPYPVIGGHIVFGPRFVFGVGLFSWSWFDWHRHIIVVDIRKAHRFHRHRFRKGHGKPFFWRHDPRHRKGVAYRDRRTSERFSGRKPLRRPAIRPETRGFPPGSFQRRKVEPARPPAVRRELPVIPRVRPERERIQRAPVRETPFRGIGEGRFERRSGERGRRSRGLELRRPDMRQPAGEMRRPSGTRQRDGGSPDGRFRR